MASDLGVACMCGTVSGVVRGISRRDCNRAVCYCDDCQAFAHYLGRAADVLDAHGGTGVVQMSPARLELTHGRDELRALKLTSKGTLRWYAGCCRTPLANTLATPSLPFVGLVETCIDAGGAGTPALDLAIGPIHGRVWGRFATGDTSGLDRLHRGPPVAMVLRLARLMLAWRLRGDHKRSPLFDARTGDPAAVPYVLSEAERAAVVGARDA